jgi:mannonate dehydratase
MGTSRRQFIKGGAALTALSTFDLQNSAAEVIRNSKDSNIELCLAYFYGLQERKIELSKQMGVTGAVSPSAPGVAGLNDVKPWTLEAVTAVKETYAKRGLQWKVLEGTPSLDKAKLGIAGRDEEIENFITLMRNLNKIGVNTICYNWMPVISWAHRLCQKRQGWSACYGI